MKKLLLLGMCLSGIGATHAVQISTEIKFENNVGYPVRYNWDMDINEHHQTYLKPGETYKHNNWWRALKKVDLYVDYSGIGDSYVQEDSWKGMLNKDVLVNVYPGATEQGEISPKLQVSGQFKLPI